MNFEISEEHEAITALAAQIFGDYAEQEHLAAIENDTEGDGIDIGLWHSLGEANLLGVALPETHGGSGLGLMALCLLLEVQGRHATPIPILPSIVYAGLPIAEFGSEEQRRRWLPRIVSGEAIFSAALQEFGRTDPTQCETRARLDDSGWVIEGEKICVPAATRAECILVPARTGDASVGLFAVEPDAPGVRLEPGRGNNHERLHHMRLEGVRVPDGDVIGDPAADTSMVEWLTLRAQVAHCAAMVGVAESALRRTAEYTSARKQFDRPIATFQGVTMRIADAFIDVEAMRATYWQAAWRLEAGLPAAEQVYAAKWWACRGGQRVVHAAQHLHGGIGADVEYPIHRYFLWARALELNLGGASEQLARLGDALAAHPGEAVA